MLAPLSEESAPHRKIPCASPEVHPTLCTWTIFHAPNIAFLRFYDVADIIGLKFRRLKRGNVLHKITTQGDMLKIGLKERERASKRLKLNRAFMVTVR